MNNLINYAINIVSRQTNKIKKKLRKNRNRLVYIVQNDTGLHKHKYNKISAVRLAAKHGAWIYEAEQNFNWITKNNLCGLRFNKRRVWFMPKT